MAAADQGNVRAKGSLAHVTGLPSLQGQHDAGNTSRHEDNHHHDPVDSTKQKGL